MRRFLMAFDARGLSSHLDGSPATRKEKKRKKPGYRKKGAGPYRRTWKRGVKMIGATAHYVTAALDEGPIIEQDVERVTHEESHEALRITGSDIERIALARAVKAHVEHRVLVHANRTIVFSRGC